MSPHVTGDARKRAERTEQPTPPALSDEQRERLGWLGDKAVHGDLSDVEEFFALVAAMLAEARAETAEQIAQAIEAEAGEHSSSLRANARRACYLNAARIARLGGGQR